MINDGRVVSDYEIKDGSLLEITTRLNNHLTPEDIEKIKKVDTSTAKSTESSTSSLITIIMKNYEGKTFELQVDPKVTTNEFREKILTVLLDKITASNCSLKFEGTKLNYDRGTLESLGIKNGSVINIGIDYVPPQENLRSIQAKIVQISQERK